MSYYNSFTVFIYGRERSIQRKKINATHISVYLLYLPTLLLLTLPSFYRSVLSIKRQTDFSTSNPMSVLNPIYQNQKTKQTIISGAGT